MGNSVIQEKELIVGVKSGDEDAFKEIFYHYKNKLFSYCCRFVKSEAIAEEIVQEVLIKIWTTRAQLNPDLSFTNYLYTIARNYSLNFLKKAATDNALKAQLALHSEHKHCEPEDNLIYSEFSAIAQHAITLLPPKRRQIYEMSRDLSMNYEDIAGQLGISKYTVKNQIVQARKSIRNYLNSHAEMELCLLFALWTLLGTF
jgi:RNA polymerase sigma-70 factor (ECF subfamily)